MGARRRIDVGAAPDPAVASLDHEADPVGALRRLAERLPAGAELLVRVPCRRRRVALEELLVGDGWTVAALASLLDAAGLEPTAVRLLPGPDEPSGRVVVRRAGAAELEELTAAEIEMTAARCEEFLDGPSCSVVVAGAGSRRRLARCLRTMERETSDCEVIAVDRAGLGLPEAWNAGARHARGRHLAFVDGDTVPEPGWLEALMEVYAAASEVGVAGSLVLGDAGAVVHAGIAFDAFGVPYHRHRGATPSLPQVTNRQVVAALAGSGLLVARRTFVRAGSFDERFHAGHAAVDLCLRLRARGLVPVYCPGSRFRHPGKPAADRSEATAADDRLLVEKWEGRLPAAGAGADAGPPPPVTRARCALAWSAPLFIRSGYAEEARTFLLALDSAGYAVSPIDVLGSARGSGAGDARLRELAAAPLPSRFAHVVHYHLPGLAARPDAVRRIWRTMFETDRLPPDWAGYANQMDEVWVPSDFNLETFARAGVAPAKLRKLPPGLDPAPYDPAVQPLPLGDERGFVFLSAFIPQRRKGWDVLLRAYYDEFDADEDVMLVLKLAANPEQSATFSEELDRFVRHGLGRDPAAGPPVHVFSGDLEPEEMPRLYRAAQAYVLPTRGEGWSRTCMEAMAMGLPAIATRWGGQLDFMNDRNSFLVDCSVVPVDELAAHELPIFQGQRWAEPSTEHLREQMRRVFEDRAEAEARGAQARSDVLAGYGVEQTAAALLERFEGLGLKPMRRPRRAPVAPAEPRAARTGPAPVVWSSPLFNRSGYANEARAFILALDRAGLEVRANPSFFEPAGYQPPSSAEIRLRRLVTGRPPERFVHVVHSPSPYFEPDAPALRTVWRTMFETDGLPPGWVARSNQVDAVWVPSHFNLESFARAGVDPHKLRWVPAGLEVELYDPTVPPLPIADARGFVFLSVFGWGRRKGWDVLARAYLEEFHPDDDVCLVIVTCGTFGRTVDDERAELERFVRERLRRRPGAGPPILVLGLDLMQEEMPRLYRAASAYVQPSRGEGFPRTLLEAMAMGLPTIGSRCPGSVEFMTDENSYLVDCTWQPVPEEAAREFPLYGGHRWAEPSVEQLRHLMRHVFEHCAEAEARGARARSEVLANWDWRRLAAEVTAALEELGCPPARRSDGRAKVAGEPILRAASARNLTTLGSLFRHGLDPPEASSPRLTTAALLGRLEAAGLDATSLCRRPDPELEPVTPPLDGATLELEAGPLVIRNVTAAELADAMASELEVTARPAPTAPPDCSAVVAGRPGAAFERCLEAVRRTAVGAEIVPVPMTAGQSLGAAWNAGATQATGRYVAFLDGRSRPEPGWLEALLAARAELPDAGLIGSRLEWRNAVVHAGVALGAHGLPYVIYQGVPADAPEAARRRSLSAVTGSGLLVERRVFVEVGGFDESYPDGHEAIDLSLRLRSRGLTALYCPGSRLRHPPLTLAPAGDRRLLERWARRLGAEDEAICRQDGTDLLAGRPAPPPATQPSSLLWTASLFTRTGYAEEARGLILALDRAGLDVHAEAMDDGDLTTRLGPADHRLLQLAKSERPERFVQVHHYPNTLYRAGAPALRNVWRTMFETDGLPRDWVSRANEMNEVWVPSEFNLETFARAGVRPEKLHKIPGGLLLEGYDPEVEPLALPGASGFVFLSIFGWEPRKGWDVLLRAYLEEFAPDEEVTLVLKIFPHYLVSFDELAGKIRGYAFRVTGRAPSQLPRVVLLEQAVAPAEMPRLYRAADAFVVPSRGEGWGRAHMEAMAMGLPTIGTRWSGNLEFMDDRNSFLVDCRLTRVSAEGAEETPHYRGDLWGEPSLRHLRRLMRQVYEDHAEGARRGAQARRDVLDGFGIERAAAAVVERLEAMGTRPRRRPGGRRSPRVLWQGPQLGGAAHASFNRGLCHALLGSGRVNLSLASAEPERLLPARAAVASATAAGRPFARRPEIVITSAVLPAEPPAAGRWTGIVAWPHGSLPRQWLDATLRMDEVWAPSEYLHDCCLRTGVEPHKLHVIRPGIDTDRHRPGLPPLTLATRKRFRFLHLGGDGPEDGTDALLEAYLNAFDRRDDVCLVIAPRDGSRRLGLLVERLRTDPRGAEILLVDHDARDELPRLCAACHCFVHVPRADTIWLELLQAQACGLPAVVSNHGTGRDLCDPEDAFLVPAVEVRLLRREVEGTPTVDFPWWAEVDRNELGKAMRKAFEQPDRARALGRRAAERVRRRFTLTAAAAAVLERIELRRAVPAVPPSGPAALSLCMMARNEERFLADCLRSVEGMVAEVVVVDTGSNDGTVEIARRHGARVYQLPWADDFSAPRNEAIQHATHPWILMLDADHTLDPHSRDEVRRLTRTRSFTAYMLRGVNYADPAGVQVFEGYDPRLFPNHPAVRFSGTVHEQLTCSRPELGFQVVPCGVVLHHYGSRADGWARRPKLLRDVPLLEAAVAKHPEDPFQVYNLGSTYLFLGRHAEAEPLLRRALELCRRRSAATSYPQYMLNVHLHLAQALFGKGRLEEAADACRDAIRAAPGLADAHALRGVVLARLGRPEEAVAAFAAALRCPDWPMYGTTDPAWRGWRSLLAIAEIRTVQGRWAEAQAAAERARDLSPQNPTAWSALAVVYAGLGRPAEADACHRRAQAAPQPLGQVPAP